nr:transcription factor GTE4 isoform X1 [Ipomoea batatas]
MMMGGGSGGHEGSKEKPKLGDKVYTRKSFKGLKSYNSNPTQELQAQEAAEDDEWSQPLVNSLPNAALESSSSLNRALAAPLGGRGVPGGNEGGKLGVARQENRVTISLSMKSKQEMRELRRKLQSELDTVRSLVKNIETKEIQKNDHIIDKAGGAKKVPAEAATTVTPRESRPLHQLSVSVLENSHGVSDNAEKEKRTPKANQFYRNSDFLLAKDKIPPAESNKKTKSNVKKVGGVESGHSFGLGKSSNQVFKNCCALLERLMKHKHGWVFNKPVDTVGLGLHDYFDIIKHPMDLGTVKSRMDSNWYKSPREFAEDVRLTFQNAMTYNPKGQDVHVMAEQLLQIFENKWPAIEADYMRELRLAVDYDVGLPTPTSRKGPKLPNSEMRKKFGRSESMTLPTDPKSKPMNPPHTGRTPVPKKPKAKDPNKRDMTYDEKQKLSMNLQNLPSEKLENVVQIIKKRNSSLSQHDDEIEVDIDSVDTETLWELDRFVTNYKKSLSKNKRKAEKPELATQPIKEIEQNVRDKKNPPVVVETTTEALNKTPTERKAEGKDISSAPAEEEKLENNAAKSSSSSTDSGSSSSDSHSESSSEGESDTEHSPRS